MSTTAAPLTPSFAPGATALADLRARVRGPLILPGDASYDEARSVWNAMIDRRPAVIVRCLGVADVVAGVAFAREHGLPLSIKGGGHNIAGLAVCEGGVTLDMSLMRGVFVDPAARIAHAQPGCLLGDVDRETQLHGLAAVLGFVSNTGIAGLTLGGGFGYLSRRHGWTCDSVESMDLVTADGRILRASEHEEPELFWALRGGGGNFGVVTRIGYRLFPVGPEIYGGAIAWPMSEAPAVLALVQSLVKSAPPELTLAAVLRLAPPAPWLAKEIHGKPVVVVVACHTGALADAERDLAPLEALEGTVGDVVQRRPYVTQQSLLDATQPKGRRYYWKSEFLPELSTAMLRTALEHAERIGSPHSAMVLFGLGGAIGSRPADHTAFGNRDAGAVVNITAAWERAEDDGREIEWARAAWRDVRQFSTGGTYVNFLTEEEGGDRIQDAYRDNYARLAAVKARWDPTNFFRANKNVAPSA